MPSRRGFLVCTGLSVLLHLLVLWLAYRFPFTVRPPEEVMEIDLSDIPRATDFLPAERGILQGRPPRPAPSPKRASPPRVPQGRVPDLPVKPDLPPEKSFPPAARNATPAAEREDTPGPPGQGAGTRWAPGGKRPGRRASPRREAAGSA